MKKIILMLFMVSICNLAQADVFGEFGLSAGHPGGKTVDSAVKNIEFGFQGPLKWGLWQTGLGGWEDTTNYLNAKGSIYSHISFGLEPDLGKLYINYFLGPALISRTDALLGNNWQFFQELGIGVKGKKRGTRIGVVFKHMSNAGIVKPNKGRNFLNLRVQF